VREEPLIFYFCSSSVLQVLDFLAKTVKECGIETIKPQRSQAIPLALLQAPYRTFLTNSSSDKKSSSILLYCLPRTVTEYIGSASEAASVRSTLLSGESSTVVALYNLQTSSIVGGSVQDVLDAASGDAEKQATLAAASLKALTELDVMTIGQVVGPSKRQDKVIVVGAGGREHALAVALAKSPLVAQVICCPGNGGTAAEDNAKIVNQGADQNNATVIALAKETGATMVVVGPEAPLVAGLVDELKVACPDVLCFGPTKAAAELEASKAFTKDFLQEHGIPTAKYQTFTNAAEAIKYVESLEESDRQVVKASGLAAGKGVLIPTTKEETVAAVKEIMSDKSFGTAGDTCVIESFMTGPEASCFALCDGKTAVLMPAAQDHKRALDNDEGLNTGGMGAYAPAPCVTPDLQKVIEQMCITTVEKMAERGTPYVGLLYAGLM
jgi:phosphoribosylaminoimidazole carboxylase (NCAIR synthetase)